MRKKILALMLTVMIGSAQVMTVSAAKSTDELEQQKAQTTAQLNETQDSINDLESKKEAITNQIGELDAQLVVTMAAVETLKTDIANKQTEIEETQQKLEAAQQDQAEQYEALKSRIQYLYENGGNTAWASLLLSGEDLSEILNQAEYTQKMYDYDRECLEKYMEITQQVSDYSDQLATEKAELEASEAEQEAQQAQLQNMLAEKKATSADYDAQLADMQAKAAEYESLIEEQNAQIQAIQEQQAAEAAAQAAAEEAARQQEAEAQQAAREAAAESNRQSSSNSSSDTQNSSSNTNSNTNSNKNNSSKTEDTSDNVSPSSGTGQDVVNYAVQFVGNPYVWGGTSLTNGADCSGFIMSVYAHFGYSLPHSSSAMRSVEEECPMRKLSRAILSATTAMWRSTWAADRLYMQATRKTVSKSAAMQRTVRFLQYAGLSDQTDYISDAENHSETGMAAVEII